MKRLYTCVVCLSCLGCWQSPATTPLVVTSAHQEFTEAHRPYAPPLVITKPDKPIAHKTYSIQELRGVALGLTRKEARELLGAPTRIESANQPGNEGYWAYENLVIHPDTGQPTRTANLWFSKGVIDLITCNPGHRTDPR